MPKKSNSKKRISTLKLVRQTHLFLALGLTPWITMYALSTIAMNHRQLLTGSERRIDPDYAKVDELSPYSVPSPVGSDSDAAQRILADLGLDGAFQARGSMASGRLTMHRNRPIGSYRITYDAANKSLLVERQKFGMSYYLEMLHRRCGYMHGYAANNLWALVVDGVILSIIMWAFTGCWMWLAMPRLRKLGSLFFIGGLVLFLSLLWIL